MSNRLSKLFSQKKRKIFSIFVTAGFPRLDSTVRIVRTLAAAGVDLIELGIPFSDSIADGATIQRANEIALREGASVEYVLQTLREIRKEAETPIILMGSLNPVLRYGAERFCQTAATAGADGLILPDLPLEIYQREFAEIFSAHNLANIFLVTSDTSQERLRMIDAASQSFIYVVSMAGVTGKNLQLNEERRRYLQKLKNLDLRSPLLVGFGIENRAQFLQVTEFADGAIVGSAFLRQIEHAENLENAASDFVKQFI
jgi:tryptophan synthase alpha chain